MLGAKPQLRQAQRGILSLGPELCFFNRTFEIRLFKGKYKKKIQHFGGPRKENLGSSVTICIYLSQVRSLPPEHLSILLYQLSYQDLGFGQYKELRVRI